jgi:hypothetical protein
MFSTEHWYLFGTSRALQGKVLTIVNYGHIHRGGGKGKFLKATVRKITSNIIKKLSWPQ